MITLKEKILSVLDDGIFIKLTSEDERMYINKCFQCDIHISNNVGYLHKIANNIVFSEEVDFIKLITYIDLHSIIHFGRQIMTLGYLEKFVTVEKIEDIREIDQSI